MVARIWTAYHVELSKALRQRMTYVGPALVLLVVLFAPLVHPIRRDGISDYDFIAFATPLALNLLGFVMLLAFTSMQISSELGSGAIRTVLVRPLLRHEYTIAKIMLGMTYAIALTLVTAAAGWLFVLLFGDFAGITYGGEIIYTDREMRHIYLFGMALALLPQFAAVAYATMISTLTRSAGAAMGLALGIWFTLDIVKHPLHVAPYVFSTYTEASWTGFQERCDALATPWSITAYIGILATSVITFAVCTAAAISVMRRRSLRG